MQGLSKTRSELPEMLVLEILSKLPVKSLTRFRCVCKPWSSSFQTPHFITKHLHNNNLNVLLKRFCGDTRGGVDCLSQLSTVKGRDFSEEENIHLPFFEICWYAPVFDGPCNGILCLHDQHDEATLWNPSTREFKILPQSSVQRPPLVDSTRFGGIGFGYDSQTDNYKLVRFVVNYFEEDSDAGSMFDEMDQVELYSLTSDSWREISYPVVHPYGSPPFNSYVNGFYYWQAIGDPGFLILSFDMVNLTIASVWWDFSTILFATFGLQWIPWCYHLPKGRNSQSSDHELVLFDPCTQELKNLGIHAYRESMQIIGYVESLIPINGRSEHEERIIRRPVGGGSN
ncbi:hypothetical protein GQ457_09G013900 [Hibiscus cannabinus]